MRARKIKICGMTHAGNLAEVCLLGPDYVGFVFYDRSPRCARGRISGAEAIEASARSARVGVFVNEGTDEIARTVDEYALHAIQLHGEEKADRCAKLRERLKVEVWKAVPVGKALDIERLAEYSPAVDLFLFDTASAVRGGSGKCFEWRLLERMPIGRPYMVSGGLGAEEASEVLTLLEGAPGFLGVDLNSRLESSPGMKDTALVERAISRVRGCDTA